MLFKQFAFIIFLLVSTYCPLVATAQNSAAVDFDPITFEIRLSELDTRDAQIEAIDAAIAQIEAKSQPNLQIYFDLFALKFEMLSDGNDTRATADLAAELGTFSLSRGEALDRNPLPYLDQAAALYEKIGDIREAIRTLQLVVRYRLNGGQSGEVVAQIYRKLARLNESVADNAAAERYLALAKAALNPDTAKSRTKGDAGFLPVDVFYATDRIRTGKDDPADFYAAGRGELEYGVVTVTIPNNHKPGEIETPSIWKLEFGPSPAKHVMVRKVKSIDVEGFFSRLQAKMEGGERKEALIFIHGFNTRFDAAAKRAAQLAHDMKYRGVPVLYSWPSAGKTLRYMSDTAVVRLSGRHLSLFLEDMHVRSGAETIHVIAHSMGNRAVTDALELLALRAQSKELQTPLFGQLFFAAPDVDAGLFEEMLKTIHPLAERMTLYASHNDRALVASRKLHGDAPRAGQGGKSILEGEFFDTVDMSELGEDMLGHTYFANNSSALADIMSLMWLNPEPEQRCGLLRSTNVAAGIWRYEKGRCMERAMISLISQLWGEGDITFKKIRQLIDQHIPDATEADALEQNLRRLLDSS